VSLLDRARAFLGRRAARTATQAVVTTGFDARMLTELRDSLPALATLTDELAEAHDHAPELVTDLLALLYQGAPQLADPTAMATGYQVNRAAIGQLAELHAVQELRERTRHDEYGAAIGALTLAPVLTERLSTAAEHQQRQAAAAEQAAAALTEALAQAEQQTDTSGDGTETAPADGSEPAGQDAVEALAQALDAAEEADAASEGLPAQAASRMRAAVNAAAKAADAKLAAHEALLAAWGVDPGAGGTVDVAERAALLAKLSAHRLAQFADLIGRVRVRANTERARKVVTGRDEVIGVDLSDRLPDVLGSELVALTNRHTRLDFLARLGEGQLLTRAYAGVERAGQGALIVLVDTSGSMEEHLGGVMREAWAKAIALGLADTARTGRRDLALINFSSFSQQRCWQFPGGRTDADLDGLLEWAGHTFGGGTNLPAPLMQAAALIEGPLGKPGVAADVVLLTDGEWDINAASAFATEFAATKTRLGFRLFTVSIAASVTPVLKALADQTRRIDDLTDIERIADLYRLV
jgi:uncharacterized protein with von Willebrand factor type A (vWA) domain